MSDSNDNTFSGGQVIINPNAPAPQILDGDKMLIQRAAEREREQPSEPHPWIAATSHPKPRGPEKPVDRFELSVKRDDTTFAKARCASMDQLLDLNRQFEEIGYHFVKLERLDE